MQQLRHLFKVYSSSRSTTILQPFRHSLKYLILDVQPELTILGCDPFKFGCKNQLLVLKLRGK